MRPIRSHPEDLRRGRSTVLDLGRIEARRPRPWRVRRLVVASVTVCLGLLVWVVAVEWLAPRGLGYLIYAAHDRLWLPLWSWLWLRADYWSLLWLAPLTILLVLALAEFLGVGMPLRRLQVAALRQGLRRNWSRGMIGFQQLLGWRRGHEGLLVAVVDCELRQAEAAARTAIEAGQPHDVETLCRMTVALAYLRASAALAQVRCAENCLLVDLIDRAKGADLRLQLRLIWGDEVTDRIEAMAMIADNVVPDAVAGLSTPGRGAEDLALLTLGIVRAAVLSQPDAASSWFTQWALERCSPEMPRDDLARAEGLIDFEFWAATCERAMIGRTRPAWLARLLPGVAMVRPLGEVAATGMTAPQSLMIDRMERQ